jgi:endonuclease/exonuclease/phosphatase (EEP) superfamily protein YafD
MRLLQWTLVCLAIVWFCAGFLGRYHGAGDILAAFRLENIAVLLGLGVWLVISRRRYLAILLFCIAGFGVVTVWPYVLRPSIDPNPQYSIYQKNLGSGRTDITALFADIDVLDPDFATFQELRLRDGEFPKELKARFPYSQICFSRPKGAMVVASKWPITKGSSRCAGSWGLVKMQAITPDGPVWIVSMHSYRPLPWAYVQNRQQQRMQKYMPNAAEAFVFGGDFNAVPWGSPLLNTAAHIEAQYGDRRRITYTRAGGLVRLSLDHILMDRQTTTGGTLRRPKFGSDHFGLLGRFNLRSHP